MSDSRPHRPLFVRLLPVAALLCACASGSIGDQPRGEESAPLVAACDFTNPPFAYLDAQGTPRGHDVELAQAIAEGLERPLVWERMPFGALLDAVAEGQVDMAVATMGRTEERARRVLFSRPYFETSILALVRCGGGEPATLEELVGRAVHASPGTTSALAARRHGLAHSAPEAEGPKDASALERLLAGQVDAALMDGPDALDLAAADPGRLRVLPEPLAAEAYCVAIRPDRPDLARSIDAVIDALDAAGRLP